MNVEKSTRFSCARMCTATVRKQSAKAFSNSGLCTSWFMVVYTGQSGVIGLGTALGWCVIPFIIPDLAKLAVAVIIGTRLRKLLHI